MPSSTLHDRRLQAERDFRLRFARGGEAPVRDGGSGRVLGGWGTGWTVHRPAPAPPAPASVPAPSRAAAPGGRGKAGSRRTGTGGGGTGAAPGITTTGRTTRGVLLKPPAPWKQAVTVKVAYKERKGTGADAARRFRSALARQGRYNAREDRASARAGIAPVEAFTAGADGVSVAEATADWVQDRRYWKLIVSPERGRDLPDLKGYVRDLMAQVREDVLYPSEVRRGVEVEWVASVHDDTDHPHAHVLMRGRIGDKDLALRPDYVAHGIRARAAEIATRELGPRTGLDAPAMDAEALKEFVERGAADGLGSIPEGIPLPEVDSRFRAAGWRVRVTLDTAERERVAVLREDLRSMKVGAKMNRGTGELTIYAGTYMGAQLVGRIVGAGYADIVRPPTEAARLRGLEMADGVWASFEADATDDRFGRLGAAGVVFTRADERRILAPGADVEAETDRAVLRANEWHNHYHPESFLGVGATGRGDGQPEAGWVLKVHAGEAVREVVALLGVVDLQYRVVPGGSVDAEGAPADAVVVYAGHMDAADEIVAALEIAVGDRLAHPAEDRSAHRFLDGIDGRYVPHSVAEGLFSDRWVDGVPLLRGWEETVEFRGEEAALDDAAGMLAEMDGAGFHGDHGDGVAFALGDADPDPDLPEPWERAGLATHATHELEG